MSSKLRIGKRRDIFLYMTQVENLFINEFLPGAPGEYVKVYLFGLMYAQYDQEIDSDMLARTLKLSTDEVDDAWDYWESAGLVRIERDAAGKAYEIQFVRQIEELYGKSGRMSAQKEAEERVAAEAAQEEEPSLVDKLVDRQIKEIFDKYQDHTGRMISRRETQKLTDLIKVYNVEPDVLSYAIDYCAELDKCNADYIAKVATRWTQEGGCRDISQVKAYLDRYSKRTAFYSTVFKELGFNRLSTPAEREMMDAWLDEKGFTVKDVLEACRATAGIREPNLRYVNKVLENKRLEAGGINTRQQTEGKPRSGGAANSGSEPQASVSKKVLRDYYDFIRNEEEKNLNARIDEVCAKIPEMRDVFNLENEYNHSVLNMDLTPEGREKRKELKEKRKALEEDKKRILIDYGYRPDFLERKYKCPICKDTGLTDQGRVCTCSDERAKEAYTWIQKRQNR